jgi:SAM-dependent methyltransferase
MTYLDSFYTGRKSTAGLSARRVAPWVLARMDVGSVVDVGCGTGSWLSAFRDLGVDDVVGFDGAWVPRDQLEIPPERFNPLDFEALEDFAPSRRFDLAISLEVAEHLPARQAPRFVDILTSLSPVVLFSAAIPQQGGVGHQNERWPEYWMELFRARGYACIDAVRGAFWDDEDVAPWYAQNSFLFVAQGALANYPSLAEAESSNRLAGRALVHPRQYAMKLSELSDPRNQSLKAALRLAPAKAWNAVRRMLVR